MIPSLPKLAFLAIDNLIFHEKHDNQRTIPLIERIRKSGFFRNPPIVAPLNDGSQRYMMLDGANRMSALQAMGFPHILVQVVEPDDPGLKLENWNHVVWEMATKDLLTSLNDIPSINLVPSVDEDVKPDLWKDCGLALVQTYKGDTYTVCTPAKELERRVHLLNSIVDCYKDTCKLDRTMARDISSLDEIYPNLGCLVTFPQFEISQILELAGKGCLLPTGITRFTVSPRALHVNYPLYELATDKTLEEKNADLKAWIQRRIESKGVRYYAEATFLYDE
jgi:L-serine kinase (ATP) / ParB family transcriptional regulator, heme-responsive regulator